MKAVIMAGGEGKRLRPVGIPLPKPMMPLCGKPVMEHIVNLLRRHGITEICAAVKYMPEPIMEYFGDGSRFGVSMEYRLESAPLGTAGGVKNCMDFIGSEDFLVISGDAACDFDLSKLIAAHTNLTPCATLALYSNNYPLPYGLVLTDRDGKIVRFIEKPGWENVVTDLVNTGIYILSPRAIDSIPENQPYDFGRDLFPRLLVEGHFLLGVHMSGYWCDIGTPQSYYQCNLDALNKKLDLGIPLSAGGIAAAEAVFRKKPKFHRMFPCPDRAASMRRLSSYFMEAGADFSSGITVSDNFGTVHIFPSSRHSALEIEVDGPSEHAAGKLGYAYFELVKRINNY